MPKLQPLCSAFTQCTTPKGMKAQVCPVQWWKPHSISASTKDLNPGGWIQNHKQWPLHYHCTQFHFIDIFIWVFYIWSTYVTCDDFGYIVYIAYLSKFSWRFNPPIAIPQPGKFLLLLLDNEWSSSKTFAFLSSDSRVWVRGSIVYLIMKVDRCLKADLSLHPWTQGHKFGYQSS